MKVRCGSRSRYRTAEINDLQAVLRVAEAQIIQAQQGVDEAISGVASAEKSVSTIKLTLLIAPIG